MDRVADDFAGIAARLRELATEKGLAPAAPVEPAKGITVPPPACVTSGFGAQQWGTGAGALPAAPGATWAQPQRPMARHDADTVKLFLAHRRERTTHG